VKPQQIAKIVGAAAATVTAAFALFNSVLSNITPPAKGLTPTWYAGIASLAALLILLWVLATTPSAPTLEQRRLIVRKAIFGAVAGVILLVAYLGTLNWFVYTYSEGSETPARHVRGWYTPLGAASTQNMSVAEAIRQAGGLKFAEANDLLWTEKARKTIELVLLVEYIVALAALFYALFSLAALYIAIRRGK
jgi:hypothetical protein